MSLLKVRINAAGTMADEFRIGKAGPTILQGTAVPNDANGSAGDLYVQYGSSPRLYVKDGATGWVPSADPSLGHVRQVVGGATGTISAKTTYVAVTHTGGATTVNLPAGSEGRHMIVKDEAGNAASNNITVVPNATDTIDGSASTAITTAFGWVHLVFGTGAWRTIGKPLAEQSPLRRSAMLTVTDAEVVTYSFLKDGNTLSLNSNFLFVFVNRMLLRASEYTVSGDSVTFLVDLFADDEIEVVTTV